MSEVEVSHRESVATVVLNDPARLNALSASMIARLHETFVQLNEDPRVRAIIVTGTGRGFCAGAETGGLRASAEAGPPADHAERKPSFEAGFTPRRSGVYKPVIVAVNGVCAAAGLHFVADGDIVICSESATFLDPHTTIGQVASLEPIIFAKCGIPMNAIMRMVILGRYERITSADALRLGLVSEVVPDDYLRQRADELADLAATTSPEAVQQSIRVIWDSLNHGLEDSYNAGFRAILAHRAHPDAKEGPTAFGEKRDPAWMSG